MTPIQRPERHCSTDPRGTPIDVLSLRPAELIMITIARHYFGSFAAPDQQGWLGGVSAALRFYGHDIGPHAAVAVLSAVQAMRRSRISAFRFNSADCAHCAAHLSENERQFLNTCRAMATNRREAAKGHAMILCEGNDTQPFLEAMAVMAQVCKISRVTPRSGPDAPAKLRRRPQVNLVDVPPQTGL
ncbi:hypothetical protein GGQ68_001236 [Sagittula marina]|uniref:Uncharacterized protein n=1 Tax=Sagittula marina TaxID=943940 RepID=A0A7W6GRH7_9RHOB|nr:hypothetical protein [Sagittula marina]MBB3984920.1 hypothetical protein [Sagittula marina]